MGKPRRPIRKTLSRKGEGNKSRPLISGEAIRFANKETQTQPENKGGVYNSRITRIQPENRCGVGQWLCNQAERSPTMDITFERVFSIINELPIALYLGKNIGVTLTNEDGTYIDMTRYAVYISYPQIVKNAEFCHTTDTKELNHIARALVYHEISHAMLTDHEMLSRASFPHNIVNILEDERIEHINRHRFLNTDFWRNLFLMNNTTPDLCKKDYPVNLEQFIYQVVRYHDYERWMTEGQFEEIMTDIYTQGYEFSPTGFEKAYETLRLLWAYAPPTPPTPNEDEDKDEDKDEEKTKSDGEGKSIPPDKKCDKSFINEQYESDEDIAKTRESKLLHNTDQSIDAMIENLIRERFTKKEMHAGAHYGYNGKLTAKRFGRPDHDWRVFREDKDKGSGDGDKVHFMIWVDISGSFEGNEEKVNNFLRVLYNLQAKDKRFTFDVATINYKATLLKDHEQKFIPKACGGNRIPKEVLDIQKRCFKTHCSNFTIVMFDGDCMTDSYWYGYGDKEKENMKCWNNRNTIIIADTQNEELERFSECPQARIKYIDKDYAGNLIKETVNLLRQVLL